MGGLSDGGQVQLAEDEKETYRDDQGAEEEARRSRDAETGRPEYTGHPVRAGAVPLGRHVRKKCRETFYEHKKKSICFHETFHLNIKSLNPLLQAVSGEGIQSLVRESQIIYRLTFPAGFYVPFPSRINVLHSDVGPAKEEAFLKGHPRTAHLLPRQLQEAGSLLYRPLT